MSWKQPDPKAPRPPSAAATASVRWRPFRLPLRAPIVAASSTIEEREGVLVELRDEEGRSGFGEATPFPADGDGGALEVLRLLEEWAPRLLAGEDLYNFLHFMFVQKNEF